jgi:hypothetical protein
MLFALVMPVMAASSGRALKSLLKIERCNLEEDQLEVPESKPSSHPASRQAFASRRRSLAGTLPLGPSTPIPNFLKSGFKALDPVRISQSKLSTIIARVTTQCFLANCLPGQRFAPLPNGNHELSFPAMENSAAPSLLGYFKNRPGQNVSTGCRPFASVHVFEFICPTVKSWVSICIKRTGVKATNLESTMR